MCPSAPDADGNARRPRRPAPLDPHAADRLPGQSADALREEVAHRTARTLVDAGRATQDPQVVGRLVSLVEDEGLPMVAELWAQSPAVSLPGALWRLYALREWVRRDPNTVARRFRLGAERAPVHEAVAGAADLPGPEDMARLADAVLTGVFTGDFGATLQRAAAFCRVLAIGAALDADALDFVAPDAAGRQTLAAGALDRTAGELSEAARLWDVNALD